MNEGRRGRKAKRMGRHNPCTYCGHMHGEQKTVGGGRWGKGDCSKVRAKLAGDKGK